MRHDPADQVGEDPTAGADAARAYRDFWTDVGSTFPDLHGARSTAQYLEDEQWLFQTHLAPLEGLRILKTDLWDEAKNTRILGWAAAAGSRAFGVDISPGIVRDARRNFEERSLTLHGVRSDVRALPFPSGSFDAIYSMGTVEHFAALLRGSKTDPQRPLPTDPLTTDRVRRRPTKLSHLIEDVTCEDGLRLLPRPTARSKALPDDQLVPEEGVLHTGLLMVARVLLPLSPSSLLHLSDRAVARGRSWSPSRHGGCPGRWNDDRRATRTRSLVDATRVVGRVRREAGDVAFDLVDQIEGRRRVVNMPAGQGVSDDHARSVDAQMKLLPAASTASAMFHGRPFTFTHSREPGTVDDEMYACARGEAAKCKVEVLTTP